MSDPKEEIEMFVAGLVLDPASNAPIVILKDSSGKACLPIWIGVSEATAIASALKQVETVRPMTHDLLREMIDTLGGKVVKIFIRTLESNTFFADIEVVVGETIRTIDSRPSDAIALAVRVSCPIFVSQVVLQNAQVSIVSQAGEDPAATPETAENKQPMGEQEFAQMDKEKWAEILAQMDPDDFKYKM